MNNGNHPVVYESKIGCGRAIYAQLFFLVTNIQYYHVRNLRRST
ncbi:MAG: hypothetical protein ACK49D_02320 [Flavobacteriia bacterium]